MIVVILTIAIVGLMIWLFCTINKDYLFQKNTKGVRFVSEDVDDIIFDLTDFFYWLSIFLCVELIILGLIRVDTIKTILPLVIYSINTIIFFIRVIPHIKLYIRESVCSIIGVGLVIFFAINN